MLFDVVFVCCCFVCCCFCCCCFFLLLFLFVVAKKTLKIFIFSCFSKVSLRTFSHDL